MGTTTNGILAYGYDLGSGDEWRVDGASVARMEALADDDAGLTEAVEAALLAAVGFTETDWRADGYFDRKKAAEKRAGVEVEHHCHGDYPMYLLSAHTITAYRGDVETVDFAALTAQAEAEEWDAKLSDALAVLGIKPKQERPAWLLVSYWG